MKSDNLNKDNIINKINIICFTDKGEMLAHRISDAYKTSSVYRCEHGALDIWTRQAFTEAEALIYVSSAGIAVRAISPYVSSKLSDPAVIVIDELGQNVIPILSGHIGGANELAESISRVLGKESRAVITTATDIEHRFAIDVWAKKHGLVIGNKDGIRQISSGILKGENMSNKVNVSIYSKEPDDGLLLIPRNVVVGIGCKKDTEKEVVSGALEKVLADNGIERRSICKLASIDIKSDEKGIIELANELGIPFVTFTTKELMDVEGEFTDSEFVQAVTGVGNVCERSALCACSKMAADYSLVVKKTALSGVTIAVAVIDYKELEEKLHKLLEGEFTKVNLRIKRD